MASTPRVLVVLRLPQSVPDLLVRARHIVETMTGSTYFPTPNPSLGAVTANIDALAAAETNARSRTSGLISVLCRPPGHDDRRSGRRARAQARDGVHAAHPRSGEAPGSGAGVGAADPGRVWVTTG